MDENALICGGKRTPRHAAPGMHAARILTRDPVPASREHATAGSKFHCRVLAPTSHLSLPDLADGSTGIPARRLGYSPYGFGVVAIKRGAARDTEERMEAVQVPRAAEPIRTALQCSVSQACILFRCRQD